MEARSKLHYPMTRLTRTFRNHWHFLLVVSLLIVVMTWPTILYVFKTDVFWVPVDSGDVWITFWNAWYLESLIAGNANFFRTDLMFYPEGLSLVYHNFTVPHMLIFGILQQAMPASNAFNFTYLLVIVLACSSAYIYLLYLFNHNWVSIFGAVLFGFSGYIVGRPQNPGSAYLAVVPLSLYFFHRSINERRWSFTLVAGFLVGSTMFADVYIFVCLLISLGLFIVCFATSRWRDASYWMRTIALLFAIWFISMFQILPMLANSDALGDVLDKTGGQERENDLLQFFINYENPIFNKLITNRVISALIKLPDPGRWNTPYLGYVPLILITSGIFFLRVKLRVLSPWLIMFTIFFFLRLGSVLTVNSQQLPEIPLPKYYLDKLIPIVFEAFYETDHFQIGLILPLAVLSCYGLLAILRSFPDQQHWRVVVVLVAIVAVEYYRSPMGGRVVTNDEIAFLGWLSDQDEEAIRLVNLPMNRGNSKQYLLYQALSGYPQVEGLARRTPNEAYRYIDANYVLEIWRRNSSVACIAENTEAYLGALDQLLADGFSHLVLHYSLLKPDTVEASFDAVDALYEDAYVAIYHLNALRESCR